MFDSKKRAELISDLQTYFSDELDHDLGQFDGEFFTRFPNQKN